MRSVKKRAASEERNIRVLSFVACGIFATAMIYGLSQLFDSETRSSGILITLVSMSGISMSQLDRITQRFWKVNIPFSILIGINLFAFLAAVPGEIFDFYYTVSWWDTFLHVFSGFGIAFVLYKIFGAVLGKAKIKHKAGFLAFVTVFATLGCAVIWETLEFTVDSIFHTNGQKFIPPEFLPSNTGSVTALDATDAEIAEFYRQPSGYRYALIDTMGDHIAFLVGTLLWLFAFRMRRPAS